MPRAARVSTPIARPDAGPIDERPEERMITQYDAVAEIEAMKVARSRRLGKSAAPSPSPMSPSWTSASEHAIRAEMERRLVRRATTVSPSDGVD
jgi:hypothetical protein